jgi:hypothetical protein
MIASITVGVIEAIDFLFVEDELTNLWKTYNLDNLTIPILNGAISATVSIFIAFYIEEYLNKHFTLFKHPAIEAFGVITGTVCVIMAYRVYLKILAKDI